MLGALRLFLKTSNADLDMVVFVRETQARPGSYTLPLNDRSACFSAVVSVCRACCKRLAALPPVFMPFSNGIMLLETAPIAC
jgi:hypothetical protein